MRNQAFFSISVLKQQYLHGKGNLPELPVQKAMLRLFPNQVFLFCCMQFIFINTEKPNQRQKYIYNVKHEVTTSVAAGEMFKAWHNSSP